MYTILHIMAYLVLARVYNIYKEESVELRIGL